MQRLAVTSTTFADGARLPLSMAFDPSTGGSNRSPQLAWTPGPSGTKSYAITCFDPDAPTTVGWWHWLLFDIDPQIVELAEGAGAPGAQPPGSVHGYTDFGFSGFGGMAPPPGDPPHHYLFNVYALDKKIGLTETATGAYVMFSIRGAVLAQGRITGTYSQ